MRFGHLSRPSQGWVLRAQVANAARRQTRRHLITARQLVDSENESEKRSLEHVQAELKHAEAEITDFRSQSAMTTRSVQRSSSDVLPSSDEVQGKHVQLLYKLECLVAQVDKLAIEAENRKELEERTTNESTGEPEVDWQDRIVFESPRDVSAWHPEVNLRFQGPYYSDEPADRVLTLGYIDFVPQCVRPAHLPSGWEEVQVILQEMSLSGPYSEDPEDKNEYREEVTYHCYHTKRARVFYAPEPVLIDLEGVIYPCSRKGDVFNLDGILGQSHEIAIGSNSPPKPSSAVVFSYVTEPVGHDITSEEITEALECGHSCVLDGWKGSSASRKAEWSTAAITPIVSDPTGIRKIVTAEEEGGKECWVTEKRYPQRNVMIFHDSSGKPHFAKIGDMIFSCVTVKGKVTITAPAFRRPRPPIHPGIPDLVTGNVANVWEEDYISDGNTIFSPGDPMAWRHGELRSPESLLPLMRLNQGEWSFHVKGDGGRPRLASMIKTVEVTWKPDYPIYSTMKEHIAGHKVNLGPRVGEHRWVIDIPIMLPRDREKIQIGDFEFACKRIEETGDQIRYIIHTKSIEKIDRT